MNSWRRISLRLSSNIELTINADTFLLNENFHESKKIDYVRWDEKVTYDDIKQTVINPS